VWWPGAARAGRDRVAVVSVSYNTRELTGLLLWSLRRIVDWPGLEIVIVDNGSRDGSAELLAEAGRAGVCVLLANDVNRRHGPGLNQAISWLACHPGRFRRGSGSWILTSSPHAPMCSAQLVPPRRAAGRRWSVSRSGTNGTRPSASGCTRCS